jgi:hypothetical protein
MPDRLREETTALVRELMMGFAARTGLTPGGSSRRYLWTDAFAVCNLLDLARRTGEASYLDLARRLVDQVHRTLGRHRDDDERRGWLSGLDDEEGGRHPTRGGLRIGKERPERAAGDPPDSRLEWEQDGQYFHYLTQWMHALHQVAAATGEGTYLVWAIELAKVAHAAFTYADASRAPKRMVWKMSIDLRRPLVPSMGHHDPLDALVTYLELESAASQLRVNESATELPDLASEITEAAAMCAGREWATEDPLGIGGLAIAAARLGQLPRYDAARPTGITGLLEEIEESLRAFGSASMLHASAERRLAFRELGLAIGLHGIELLRERIGAGDSVGGPLAALQPWLPLAQRIEDFWVDPASRQASSWIAHREINSVMLATSLSPDAYLRLEAGRL